MQKIERIETTKGLRINMVTTTVRSAYQSLFTPYVSKEHPDSKPNYYITILFDKNSPEEMQMVQEIKDAEVELLKLARLPAENPLIKRSIKDGDVVNVNGRQPFPGYFFMRVKSNAVDKDGKPMHKPSVFDRDGSELTEETSMRIKSGDYVRVMFSLAVYNMSANKGVGAYLSGVKKFRVGDPIGGGFVSSDAFGDDDEVFTEFTGAVAEDSYPY